MKSKAKAKLVQKSSNFVKKFLMGGKKNSEVTDGETVA